MSILPCTQRGALRSVLYAKPQSMLSYAPGGRITPSEISNGQKKRVALARALIIRPEVMIYDEPTTGQDPVMIRYVDDMIEEVQDEFDITSIVISHDMVSTFRIADRVAMLHKGHILAYGTPDELKRTRQEECKRFIFAGSFTD